MKYLVLHKGEAFYTNWFSKENNYETGMIVFNMENNTYTTDGDKWKKIEQDHL